MSLRPNCQKESFTNTLFIEFYHENLFLNKGPPFGKYEKNIKRNSKNQQLHYFLLLSLNSKTMARMGRQIDPKVPTYGRGVWQGATLTLSSVSLSFSVTFTSMMPSSNSKGVPTVPWLPKGSEQVQMVALKKCVGTMRRT